MKIVRSMQHTARVSANRLTAETLDHVTVGVAGPPVQRGVPAGSRVLQVDVNPGHKQLTHSSGAAAKACFVSSVFNVYLIQTVQHVTREKPVFIYILTDEIQFKQLKRSQINFTEEMF